jgi:hypothetical protein
MSAGPLFLASLIFLGLVVCVVYTLAVEAQAPANQLFRSTLHRLLRLFGVLAALAVVVYFFGML